MKNANLYLFFSFLFFVACNKSQEIESDMIDGVVEYFENEEPDFPLDNSPARDRWKYFRINRIETDMVVESGDRGGYECGKMKGQNMLLFDGREQVFTLHGLGFLGADIAVDYYENSTGDLIPSSIEAINDSLAIVRIWDFVPWSDDTNEIIRGTRLYFTISKFDDGRFKTDKMSLRMIGTMNDGDNLYHYRSGKYYATTKHKLISFGNWNEQREIEWGSIDSTYVPLLGDVVSNRDGSRMGVVTRVRVYVTKTVFKVGEDNYRCENRRKTINYRFKDGVIWHDEEGVWFDRFGR